MLLLFTLPGCLGPTAIKQTRLRYNEAYRKTNDEQLLLNIVRLRYADSPVFMDLSNIASQFESALIGGGAGGLDGQGPGPTRLGTGELHFRDAPTLSYQPRDGNDMGKELLTPLTAELLRLFSPGSSFEQFMTIAVNDINDIPNATLATGLTPSRPDDNARFRHVVCLLLDLQQRQAIEMGIGTYDGDSFDPIPASRVKAADMLNAAKEGYTYRITGQNAVLHRREKRLVIQVVPEALEDPALLELVTLLKLRPGEPSYKILTESDEDAHPEDLPSALGSDTITLNMRSMLEIFAFLAKGVSVPESHIRDGTAPTTLGPDGCPYDWTRLTSGVFQVRSARHRPADAEVAVSYRGFWFYIDRQDTHTRSTLALLEILHALEESNAGQTGPLLTLPIN
jgi:hypothetical protein